MPIPSTALMHDPTQDWSAGFFSDMGTAQYSGEFTRTVHNPLPLLPPPPPESPPAPSPAVEPVPDAPRSRHARQEVDEANIITSIRTQAPNARKRGAADDNDEEADIPGRPSKRSKGRQYLYQNK
ncbi:hypothetical protein K438DRAFT_1774830 [Mycena galopus ATCC 62051]|nr:hypothetical protein K438DRAFT_1774830 [Mycena galopus ATCC 62051]